MRDPLPEKPGYGPQPLTFDTAAGAWAYQREHNSSYPFPLGGGAYAIPQEPPKAEPVTPQGMSMAEFQERYGPVHAPPTPGSAAKAAQLHEEDKPRIDAKVAAAAEKRRTAAEKEAAAKRKANAQRSLFGE